MSEHPGPGVMLAMLCGNEESVNAWRSAEGKTIKTVAVIEDNSEANNSLRFTFDDGSRLDMRDMGQSCCEYRYMTCDDDLSHFVGAKLLDAELRDGPDGGNNYGDPHEVQFLIVKTSVGDFTVASHNKHNGYYGGFAIRCFYGKD